MAGTCDFDNLVILEEVIGRAECPIPVGTNRFCAIEGIVVIDEEVARTGDAPAISSRPTSTEPVSAPKVVVPAAKTDSN